MFIFYHSPTLILIVTVAALINFGFVYRLMGKHGDISQSHQYQSPLRIKMERQKWKARNKKQEKHPIRAGDRVVTSRTKTDSIPHQVKGVVEQQQASGNLQEKPATNADGSELLGRNGHQTIQKVNIGSDSQSASASQNANNHVDQTISSPCLNANFRPVNSKSVWTIVTDDHSGYVSSAVKLGQSVLKNVHDEGPIDLVVMELQSKPLTKETWQTLHSVGWQQCTVERIAPLDEEEIRSDRFVDQFTKLHAWGMTMYDTLLFLDSDTLVLGSIDELLRINLYEIGKPIAVARDFRPTRSWMPTFNMGIFLIHPNEDTYHWLMEQQRDPNLQYLRGMSEQGLLNRLYSGSDKWHDIGFEFNANTWIYDVDREYWDAHEEDIKIVHYTNGKPWLEEEEDCNEKDDKPCFWWLNYGKEEHDE